MVSSEFCLNIKFRSSSFFCSVVICHQRNPPWGRDATSFYSHLLSQIYINNHVDCVFVCGDINGRVGKMNDVMTCIDDIPIRESIDPVKNNHGDSFIEVLMECKMCITNGRITPEHDHFTSISTRGKMLWIILLYHKKIFLIVLSVKSVMLPP